MSIYGDITPPVQIIPALSGSIFGTAELRFLRRKRPMCSGSRAFGEEIRPRWMWEIFYAETPLISA